MKVYLDNCIVSAIAKGDHPNQSKAIESILQSFEAGDIELVTSIVTQSEINDCAREDNKKRMQQAYDILKKVPFVEKQELTGFSFYFDQFGGWNSPIMDADPVFTTLRKIPLTETDAHHVMLAIKSHCDVFLTLDTKTILKSPRRENVESIFPIRLMLPTELLSLLSD